MTWQRARSEEQKEKRLQQIAEAAEKLFKKHNYADITLKMIADQLSFTRANLYKYVHTKEEIFLMIFQHHIHIWVETALQMLPAAELPLSDAEFARRWMEAIATNQMMLKVRPLLNTIIETNVTAEPFVEFKSAIWQDAFRLLPLLQKQLPGLDKAGAKRLFKTQMLFAGALFAALEIAETHWKLLKACDPELERTDFKTAFQDFMLIQLRGLKAVNN